MKLRDKILYTWPPRFLMAILTLLFIRLIQHAMGHRPFDPSEFLNLPVAVVIGIVFVAMITDPTRLGPSCEDECVKPERPDPKK